MVKNTTITAAIIILVFSFYQCSDAGKNTAEMSTMKLSDKNATDAAQTLYNNLYQLSKNKFLVGHQDALAYGVKWKGDAFRSDINDVCGEFPAIFGWDLGHIADPANIDSVPFADMKNWAIEAYKKGGINTYGWHALNFCTGGSSWDVTPCVNDILPAGKLHNKYLQKLDMVANFFAELKDDNGNTIPVMFRPFHEMNGGWFWWGAESCTPEEYKELWQFTVDYLRNQKKLHNIIYIYSTDVFSTADEYLTFYPGDEYVDVLGYDDYKGLRSIETTNQSVKMLEILSDLATEKSKLYTISETGYETLSDSTWFTKVLLPTIKTNKKTQGIAYVLLWRNGRPDHFYAPYPGHKSANDFITFKKDPMSLFLSEIENMYERSFMQNDDTTEEAQN